VISGPERISLVIVEIVSETGLLVLPNSVNVLARELPHETQVLLCKDKVFGSDGSVEENGSARTPNNFEGEERIVLELNIVEGICVPTRRRLDLNRNFPSRCVVRNLEGLGQKLHD
jgi:hypothetical protein